MTRIRKLSLLAVLALLATGKPALGAEAKAEATTAPDFQEVYDLVRAHLAGMSEAQLNQTAVQALITGLGPRVSLVTNGAVAKARPDAQPVGRSSLFEGGIAYLRIERVGDGLAGAVRDACWPAGRWTSG